jgi:hypothetical protein
MRGALAVVLMVATGAPGPCSADRPVALAIACEPADLAPAAICTILADAIRAQAIQAGTPDRTVTLEAPPPAGAVPLRLVVEARTPHRIVAHLEAGTPADLRRAPATAMNVMDAPLSDVLLARYLGDLWALSRPVLFPAEGASP